MSDELRNQNVAANPRQMHQLLTIAVSASSDAEQLIEGGHTTQAIGPIAHIARH